MHSLQLSTADIDRILNALGELPAKDVYHLIASIHAQVNAQMQPQEEPQEGGDG